MPTKNLNPRQIELLRRIGEGTEPVTSKEPSLAVTVYALRNRGLATARRKAGEWTALITDAGSYYLEHGRYADQDARKSQGSSPSPPRATRRATSLGFSSDELMERLVAGGGSLRIPDPDPKSRAAWRRALHAVKRSPALPEGKLLWHRGRDHGDIVIELRERPEARPGSGGRERATIPLPERLSRLHPLIASLKEAARKPRASAFGWQAYPERGSLRRLDVPGTSLSRALRLMQALLSESERRGHHVRAEVRGRQGMRDICIVVKSHAYPVTVKERDGRLQVTLPDQYGRRKWSDGSRRSIEDKLGDVLAEIEARAEQDELRRLDQERQAEERRRRWEEAMREARERFVQDHRAGVLRKQIESWRLAQEIRGYCRAVREKAATAGGMSEDAGAWLEWAASHAEAIDPVVKPPGMPADPEPTGEALRPYLGGWNPWSPGV